MRALRADRGQRHHMMQIEKRDNALGKIVGHGHLPLSYTNPHEF